MAARKKGRIDAAYAAITGAEKHPESAEKVNSVGVKLSAAELERLNQIAVELGVNRHALMQFALRDFIARYDRGEKPKTEVKPVITLKVG
jgi:metal-responsive CopG/Arc/MetJ family transcriptional regulator